MPRGAAPAWRQRKEPVRDDWVLASIQRRPRPGPDGHHAELHITGLDTREMAREEIRALHRSARFLTKYSEHNVGVRAHIRKTSSGYYVQFWAVDKTAAKKYVLDTYGPDRSKWPYDPRRKGNPDA
jgi:hypothetical protein